MGRGRYPFQPHMVGEQFVAKRLWLEQEPCLGRNDDIACLGGIASGRDTGHGCARQHIFPPVVHAAHMGHMQIARTNARPHGEANVVGDLVVV